MNPLPIVTVVCLVILGTSAPLFGQGLSIRTSSQAACSELCTELVFDCNAGAFSDGWCVIVTEQAPVVESGLAIKTPTQRVCDDTARSLGDTGRWDPSSTWCRIGPVVSYLKIPNAGIPGHNIRILHDTSLDACRAACTETDACKSFDYARVDNICWLQDVTAADVGGLKTDYPGDPYDHYVKQR